MKKQQGLSIIGLILMLALVGGVGMLGIKILPIYLESFAIDKALKSVAKDSGRSLEEIRNSIMRHFEIDDIDRIKPNDIQLISDAGKRYISIKYVAKEHLFDNLDIVATFDKREAVEGVTEAF